jgi:hypothetical protein
LLVDVAAVAARFAGAARLDDPAAVTIRLTFTVRTVVPIEKLTPPV